MRELETVGANCLGRARCRTVTEKGATGCGMNEFIYLEGSVPEVGMVALRAGPWN